MRKINGSHRNVNWRKICLGLFVTGILLMVYVVNEELATWKRRPQPGTVNYAVVIDAGSSGSRAYLYHWLLPSSGSLLKISPLSGDDGKPMVEQVAPGMSSLATRPGMVMSYVKPLLDYAARNIPSGAHGATQLFILATAGMRLLLKEQQDAIMSSLKRGIQQQYGFQFPDGNLEVISGRQEGIYQWLSVNYALGRLQSGGGETVGALDMGGASMQIATEVPPSFDPSRLSASEKSRQVNITIGCRHSYKLFVATFLGYGANEALERHHRNLLLSQPKGTTATDTIPDPCLHSGHPDEGATAMKIDLDRLADPLKAESLVSAGFNGVMFSRAMGDWNGCYDALEGFMSEGEEHLGPCTGMLEGCPSNGIILPPDLALPKVKFYGFSEFWYAMDEVFGMGGAYDYDKFSSTSREFCRLEWTEAQRRYPEADEDTLKNQCFKSAWVAATLHEGFKLPKNSSTHLTSAPSYVEGSIVHWTTGALLHRISSSGALKDGSQECGPGFGSQL